MLVLTLRDSQFHKQPSWSPARLAMRRNSIRFLIKIDYNVCVIMIVEICRINYFEMQSVKPVCNSFVEY